MLITQPAMHPNGIQRGALPDPIVAGVWRAGTEKQVRTSWPALRVLVEVLEALHGRAPAPLSRKRPVGVMDRDALCPRHASGIMVGQVGGEVGNGGPMFDL